MDITHESLREMATSDDPLEMLLAAESSPVIQLMLAGQLMRATLDLEREFHTTRQRKAHDKASTAVAESIGAAKVALEAAVNMVYELHWMMENCQCLSCKSNRLRDQAENN